MSFKITTLLPAALAVVMTLPVTLDAQRGQGRGQGAQIRFAAMDTNGDGMIQRSEWRGNDRSFMNQDWNRDGVLSGPEVRRGGRRDADLDVADHVPNRFERFVS